MYRNYENPNELESLLKEARELAEQYPDNIDYADYVHELEERVNFAWQDDEYDSNYYC